MAKVFIYTCGCCCAILVWCVLCQCRTVLHFNKRRFAWAIIGLVFTYAMVHIIIILSCNNIHKPQKMCVSEASVKMTMTDWCLLNYIYIYTQPGSLCKIIVGQLPGTIFADSRWINICTINNNNYYYYDLFIDSRHTVICLPNTVLVIQW